MIKTKTKYTNFKLEYDSKELFKLLNEAYSDFSRGEILTLYYVLNDKRFDTKNINKNKTIDVTFEQSPIYEIIISTIDLKKDKMSVLKEINQYIRDNFLKEIHRVRFKSKFSFRMWCALNRVNESCTNFSQSEWLDYIIHQTFLQQDLLLQKLSSQKKQEIPNMIEFLKHQGVELNIQDVISSKKTTNAMIIKSNQELAHSYDYNIYTYKDKNIVLNQDQNLKDLLILQDLQTSNILFILTYMSLVIILIFNLPAFVHAFITLNTNKLFIFSIGMLFVQFLISKFQYNAITLLLLLLNKKIKHKNKLYDIFEKMIINIFYVGRHFALFTDTDSDSYFNKELINMRILLENKMSFNIQKYTKN